MILQTYLHMYWRKLKEASECNIVRMPISISLLVDTFRTSSSVYFALCVLCFPFILINCNIAINEHKLSFRQSLFEQIINMTTLGSCKLSLNYFNNVPFFLTTAEITFSVDSKQQITYVQYILQMHLILIHPSALFFILILISLVYFVWITCT